jgi:hypothetical protein
VLQHSVALRLYGPDYLEDVGQKPRLAAPPLDLHLPAAAGATPAAGAAAVAGAAAAGSLAGLAVGFAFAAGAAAARFLPAADASTLYSGLASSAFSSPAAQRADHWGHQSRSALGKFVRKFVPARRDASAHRAAHAGPPARVSSQAWPDRTGPLLLCRRVCGRACREARAPETALADEAQVAKADVRDLVQRRCRVGGTRRVRLVRGEGRDLSGWYGEGGGGRAGGSSSAREKARVQNQPRGKNAAKASRGRTFGFVGVPRVELGGGERRGHVLGPLEVGALRDLDATAAAGVRRQQQMRGCALESHAMRGRADAPGRSAPSWPARGAW